MTGLSTCISFLILLGYKVNVVKALTRQISKGEEYEKDIIGDFSLLYNYWI